MNQENIVRFFIENNRINGNITIVNVDALYSTCDNFAIEFDELVQIVNNSKCIRISQSIFESEYEIYTIH